MEIILVFALDIFQIERELFVFKAHVNVEYVFHLHMLWLLAPVDLEIELLVHIFPMLDIL